MKKNEFKTKIFALVMAVVILVTFTHLDTIAEYAGQIVDTISGNSVSENDAEKVPDFDAASFFVKEQGAPAYMNTDMCKCDDGDPKVTFTRFPTQGKKASELLPGEWMYDQEMARTYLFDEFNKARKKENWKLKDNSGNWYSCIPTTVDGVLVSAEEFEPKKYVWDENLEAVAMQRAIEQIGVNSHVRPTGCHYSEVYKYYSVTGIVGNAYNSKTDDIGSLNPYWTAAEVNELTYCFNTYDLSTHGVHDYRDVSTDAAIAYLIVNDPDLGYMEYNKTSGGQAHREAILTNDLYRIGIGCVRTSDGHVITAVALAYDWDYATGDKIPVTAMDTHIAEEMENLFSATYVTCAAKPNAKGELVKWTLTNVENALETLTYTEGTPVLKRPTLNYKDFTFGSVSEVGTATWNTSGKYEDGSEGLLLNGTWYSTDTSVVTVASDGTITPIGPGTAAICNEGEVFTATLGIQVVEIPLPDFEFVPVFSSQEWDVSKGTLKIPYTLVCRSYESEEEYGEVLSITGRDVSITSSNADVTVTNTVASDGMSGVVTLTYTGDKANIMDGVSGTQIVFGSTDSHLLNKYTLWMSISNSGSSSSSTGSTNAGTEDTKDDNTQVVSKETKQTISIGNSKFKKATKKSKAYTIKRSKVKKTKVYNMKVKVKTDTVGHGKVTYKVTYPKGATKKQKKLFTVKKGKITIKKGVKKGTYKITITAAKVKGLFKKATKTVYVKVK